MAGEVELINLEKVTELQGELTEAKTIEKAEIEMLRDKRPQNEGGADDKQPEPEVKLELVEMKAEEIIPKECWGLILQNLDDEDLLSCRLVCKTFKQLLDLKEFKVKWKFKFALPFLFPYLKTSAPNGDTSWKHLSNPRIVCRSWRRAIDKYTSEVHGRESSFLPTDELPLLIRFRTFEDIQEFQEKFGENTNPFPSRSVCISNPVEELVEADAQAEDQLRYYEGQLRLQKAYIEKVGELLEQFGTHIFRLRLCFEYEHICGPTSLALCKLIGRGTIHLPNLKELFIRNQPCHSCDQESEDEVIGDPAALPNLEALSICRGKKVEDYLLKAFSPQLTQLQMQFSKDCPSQFQMQELKNVRKLRLPLYDASGSLESLRFLQSPLEQLKLTCMFQPAQEPWNVDEFLRNLKHLPLELLEIELLNRDRLNLSEAGIDLEEYKNESVKTLTILIVRDNLVGGDQISFNFLQALKKLENLQIKFTGTQLPLTHPGEVGEVVRLNEYLVREEGTSRIYHSNVWEKVPSLKTIALFQEEEEDEFVKSIFTREEYERIKTIAGADGPNRN